MLIEQRAERRKRIVEIQFCREYAVIYVEAVAIDTRAKVEYAHAAIPHRRESEILGPAKIVGRCAMTRSGVVCTGD